jgi:hypothetical protein
MTASRDCSHLIPELLARADPRLLERYVSEICIDRNLKSKVNQLLSGAKNDVPDDAIVTRALHMIYMSLLIRDALKLDMILGEEYFPESQMKKLEEYSCLSVVGDDARGNTVIYFNLSKFDPAQYRKMWEEGVREVPSEFRSHPELNDPAAVNLCSLWYVRMMEWIHKNRFTKFRQGQVPEPRVVLLINLDSVGINAYTHELRQFLKGIRMVGGYLFPEICDYIFASNVPWLADKIWPVVRLILHHATAARVQIYDRTRTVKYLPELIHPNNLPPCFGGHWVPDISFRG